MLDLLPPEVMSESVNRPTTIQSIDTCKRVEECWAALLFPCFEMSELQGTLKQDCQLSPWLF